MNILSILISAVLISWVPAVAYAVIRYVWSCLKRENDVGILATKKEKILVYGMCFLISVGYLTMKDYWGSNTIGSFFSRNEFEAQYYVNIFPEDSKSKNYRLIADVHQYDGNTIFLKKVYWPNGGYSTFEDLGDGLCFEYATSWIDDNKRVWRVELTHDKVK